MSAALLRVKDIRPYLATELKDLFYDDEEISALAKIIVKTIFKGAGLHQIHNSSELLTSTQVMSVKEMSAALKSGKPHQYVTGETEFLGCRIKVGPGVLIPRPETEELTDLIIRENKGYEGKIADFGTGSGCIAIALAIGIPGSVVTGYDNSDEALRIASENAALNNADVRFRYFDLLHPDKKNLEPAGIIVSNPPYVLNSEKALMRKNVLDFEPPGALFVDDVDPLLYYRKILEIAPEMPAGNSRVYFEINELMGLKTSELLSRSGYRDVQVIRDLNNRDRFIKAIKQ